MPLGFKKAYKALYIPTNQPSRRTLPAYHWIAVRHRGISKTKAAEDFITKTDFECAKTKEARKKLDFSAAFFTYEGIQCLRIRTL